VRDLSGKAVPGVSVQFVVHGADGSNVSLMMISSSSGIAGIPVWRLPTVAGGNVTRASLTSGQTVEFRATGTPGSPALIAKVAGDAQMVPVGLEVPGAVEVRVTDQHQNPIPGVHVGFDIVSGEGTLSASGSVTNGAGIARAPRWVLLKSGDHTLSAAADGIAPVMFRASAFKREVPPCTVAEDLRDGADFESILGDGSCTRADGVPYAGVTTSRLDAGEYVFTVRSDDFDTYLELVDSLGHPIGFNDNATGSTSNSEIRALMPSGGATLVVSAARSGARGRYTLGYTRAALPDTCRDVFATRGVSTSRSIQNVCSTEPWSAHHSYQIYLRQGETMRVIVEDLSYSDWQVEFYGPGTNRLQVPNLTNPTYFFTYDLTAFADGFYNLRVGSVPISDYNLTIK
jgi:hypothetical protein